jgi:hypothetical protein
MVSRCSDVGIEALQDKSLRVRRRYFEPGDSYAEGFEAAEDGQRMDSNPYKESSRDWELWREGFLVSEKGAL